MMKSRFPVLTVATILWLGGCVDADNFGDEPVRAPYIQPGYEVAAGPGDTVESMAARFRISPDELIRANHLRPPYRLKPYQPLIIPPPATYQVRDGDTVGGIAASLGVDEVALAQANGLTRPYHMVVGQVLRVPGGMGGGDAVATPEPEFAPPSLPPRSSITAQPLAPPPAPAAPPPESSTLAPRFASPHAGASVAALAPQTLQPPQTLPPARTFSAPQAATAAPTSIVPKNAAAPVKPAPAREAAPPPQEAMTAQPEAGGQPRFIKPVSGQVIEAFGKNGGGQANDGINISAAAGTTVNAADAGTVIYAGNELAAFGNLILIRHAGGWVTAYGHLASIGVKKGAEVSQGQSIGTVGQTGSVTAPQLHFEIRQGSKPVDPAQYLAGSRG